MNVDGSMHAAKREKSSSLSHPAVNLKATTKVLRQNMPSGAVVAQILWAQRKQLAYWL